VAIRKFTPEQRAAASAKTRAWRLANPERARLLNANRPPLTAVQREKRRVQQAARRANDPGLYRERYRLTASAVNAILETQDGRCAICRCGPPKQGFDLDHDHSTGRVRGFLCRGCNMSLGFMRDDADLLLAAIDYLRRHS
jgi:hypothetical protein